jgi:S-adenosylmethionine hydrolase
MSVPIITLTTDFGLKDPYVAEMKAVIMTICPNARIVDISHEIEKFNVRIGAFVLASAAPYFPEGTIHVVIVDPGVGTKRKPILIETENAYFVGPDNGVMALAAEKLNVKNVYEMSNPKLMLLEVSSTFHGRDIFAPASAHLANGTLPAKFGPRLKEFVTPKFARIIKKRNALAGEIIHVDDFGNIITNFRRQELKLLKVKDTIGIRFKKARLKLKLSMAYGDTDKLKPLVIIGSHGFLEISVNQGNAAKTFQLKSGDKITLCRFC